MTKQEKIKEKIQEAYENLDIDWNWISIFIDFSSGFNFKTDIRLTLKPEDLEIVENPIGIMWRPKSLQGIEDNNGWIKIESEDDLPKEYDFYDACYFEANKEDITMFYALNLPTLKEYFKDEIITHYQQIVKRKPPIH